MKKLIIISILFYFGFGISVYAQNKGLVFEQSDKELSTINFDGVDYVKSVKDKSIVYLAIEPHAIFHSNLHVNLAIELGQNPVPTTLDPNDVFIMSSIGKKGRRINSCDPQAAADNILIQNAYFENRDYLAQTQQLSGLIGVSAAKKKIRQTIIGTGDPKIFALIGKTLLNEQKPNCMGLVLFPMVKKKSTGIEIHIPVGNDEHVIAYEVRFSKNISRRDSKLTALYNSAVNSANMQNQQVKAQIGNAASQMFQQGFQNAMNTAGSSSQQTQQSNSNSTNNSYESQFFSTGGSTGTVTQKNSNGTYSVKAKITCNQCGGSGKTEVAGITVDCTRCHGKGYIGE